MVLQKSLGGPLDAAACEREPIHLPGHIQPHGALLAFDPASLTLTACSANVATFLKATPEQLLGRSALEILPADFSRRLASAMRERALPTGNPVGNLVHLRTDAAFQAWVHERDGTVFVEFEPADMGAGDSQEFQTIDRRLLELKRITSLDALLQAIVTMVRDMTGFERVLLYAFDDEWNGRTVAEDMTAGWGQSFIGLHFPSSDIPRQARALYAENLIRFMPDCDYAPSPLVALDRERPPLDLSGSRLRSLSPVHLEYQRNIGVAGSMSASVIKDGALWGLLVGHHRTPFHVPPQIATDILILVNAFALRLSELEKEAMWTKQQRQQVLYGQLLEQMSGADDFLHAIDREAAAMMELLDANGAVVLHQNAMVKLGQAPSDDALRELLDWARDHRENGIYATDNLAGQNQSLAASSQGVTGLLAVFLDHGQDAILWFRPEIVETITWAGNPEKRMQQTAHEQLVLPRRSFEAWVEQKRGFSQAWSNWELTLAAGFGQATEKMILRHQRQIRELSDKLARIEQLHAEQKITQDALNIALAERSAALRQREMLMREVDHRVKNSLQLISSVLRLQGHRITDGDARHHFAEASRRVMTVAQVHQRLYQTERVKTVEFAEYLRGLCGDLADSLAVDPNLLMVEADEADIQTDHVIPLGLIVNELITNAFKYAYADRKPGTVHVSFRHKGEDGFILTVADRGRGIPEGFDPGKSSGLGMKLITMMAAKLGADLQVEANEGGGARFTVVLPDITSPDSH